MGGGDRWRRYIGGDRWRRGIGEIEMEERGRGGRDGGERYARERFLVRRMDGEI